ncbi:FAD-dependent oxidoreductase [Halalkalibacillus sediminis]|uniref:FAD-dependent oxidoreductase n=1 Tax=Halalkalibacillus sediminis TaxID=2018042 RepID=A0A2I0QVP7_9BACI|nr:FAD-binding oxidoreductase [Halalkalibacillus sediminis]PKR78398.1 FAD-dependent oxidoreductase [Halalkalibacillus sediminis]
MKPYIIVGAGILGASTAFHLAEKGHQVILIDKKDVGEATRASAGIISPWLSQKQNPELYDVIRLGASYYPQLIGRLKEIGINHLGYDQVGSYHLHKSHDKLEKMMEDAKDRRTAAPEIGKVSLVKGESISKSVPVVGDRMGAVFIEGGAKVNSEIFRNALIEGAKYHGAEIIEGQAELKRNDLPRVHVNDQTLEAEKVIVTTGAWANSLLKEVGINFNVYSTKTQTIKLRLPEADTSKWPVVMLPNNKYIVGFNNHEVLVGAEHHENHDFESFQSASAVFDLLKVAFKFAPGLKEAEIIESRVGFRPIGEKNHPVFGKHPTNEKLIIANGLGASGMTSGPFLGLEIAKIALNEETHLDQTIYQY